MIGHSLPMRAPRKPSRRPEGVPVTTWNRLSMTAAALFTAAALGVPAVSLANQHVACPTQQVQVEITTPLGGWKQTPQGGTLMRTLVQDVGGTKMLLCIFRVNRGEFSAMRPFPEAFSACKPVKDGFSCK
jgi:hypothetical protein